MNIFGLPSTHGMGHHLVVLWFQVFFSAVLLFFHSQFDLKSSGDLDLTMFFRKFC